jgi:hypothetical protein
MRRTGALVAGNQVVDLCLARAAFHAGFGRPRYRSLAEAEVPNDMLELLQGGGYAIEAAREAVQRVHQRR